MELQILGPLGVIEEGRQVPLGGHRQRAVLAALALHVREPLSTERLIELVWGDEPPPSARKSLQTYLSRLRRLLGDGLVIGGAPTGYVLRLDGAHLDALRFEELSARGRQLVARDPAGAWDTLGAALALWRGSPLAGLDLHVDLATRAGRLQEARLLVVEERAEAGLALGLHHELVGELSELVAAHPLRERAWGQLMLALYRSGRSAEALEAFQRYRRLLADELGLEPSAQLRELEDRILRQDPALDEEGHATSASAGATPARRPVRNPYKGLRAFSEDDADDFFGRATLVGDLIGRIERGIRFLALVGPSGSGKSSVARAGLVPALQALPGRAATRTAWMTPGTHPFAQLDAALSRAGPEAARPVPLDANDDLALLRAVLASVPDERTDLLLVVDQFEELLTEAIPAETVQAFVRNLAEAVQDPHGQLIVVVTLRADFLAQALQHPELADLLGVGVVTVPPLTSIELQAAIVRPAAAVGLEVEPELVAELVAETSQHPASLPLLQFVLTELTDQADGSRLTLAALHQLGGIRGTLAREAEELYSALSEPAKEAARWILLRLVTLNDLGEATRRTVRVDELQMPAVGDDVRREVLDRFVGRRLLTYGHGPLTGQPTVEVTHEAVLREWPRCASWIEEARADIRLGVDLERAAVEWTAADRSPDYLLTGSRLRRYEDWVRDGELGVSDAARTYLDASLDRRREEERTETARLERERELERRAVSRLRVGVAFLALLVLVTTGLSFVAAARSREAERERTAAQSLATEMLVRQLSYAAVAEAGNDPELSLLLALHTANVASIRHEPLPREAVEALHWGLQELRVQYPVEDGDVFVLAGTTGPRGAYRLPIAGLLQLARDQVTRQLSAAECRAYLRTDDCPELPAEVPTVATAPAAATARSGPPLAGTTVRVTGLRTDTLAQAIRREFEEFTDRTGIEVIYVEETTLEEQILAGEVQDRTDLAVVAQPGLVETEAAAGRSIDLDYLARDRIVSDVGRHLGSLAVVGDDGDPATSGTLAAIPLSVNVKSLVWFSPRRFAAAGYEVPTTWEQLIALGDRIVADGGTPWCFAMESGEASGWPATDWVEDLVLRGHGPEVYDAWSAGEISFTDPRIRDAFERLGQLFFPEGYVHGGANAALGTWYWAAIHPLLDDPPGCWLHHQASFIADSFPPDLEVDADISAFPTPTIDDAHRETTLIAGDFLLAYTDRPEVRELVRYVASPDFGRFLTTNPGFMSPNRRFDPDHYPEEWRRAAAATLRRALEEDLVRFDASDRMPPPLGTGIIWSAMMDYLRGGPDTLDDVLGRLDAAAAAIYPQRPS
jgi:DNA-binding SARP family transcriptional activator/ABC-type glycerol-3-phosphate transport system substrate-binding protein